MRLKCIKLVGFKSFVDATTVNFPSNMCAVVGPNGCGKSNIIDAVRWVMGESSAKHLRGESMTDVIFNGAAGRKPVGQASIELVFDNSEKKLGGQYAAFNEISIKRRVTRDGQSDYYLNGSKCRRRDITDIFLGTGLGPRSYAIIEQGMISRLIEAKPEELRVFLEEAAGISKYKERRRDTENRMRRTRENLERLTDIRDELERQLNRLKRQARAAERYKELKQEERKYKAEYQALQWRRHDALYQEKRRAITAQELKVEENVTTQVSINSQLENLGVQRSEKNDALGKVQAEYYSFGAEIARLEQIIQNQKERSRQLDVDAEQVLKNIDAIATQLRLDEEKIAQWGAEVVELEPQQQTLDEQQRQSAAALHEAEQAMQNLQQRWDALSSQMNDEQRKADVEQSRIQHYDQVLDNVRQRLAGLSNEREQLVSTPVEEQIAELLTEVETLDTRLQAFAAETQATKAAVDEIRDSMHQRQQRLNQQRSELEKMQGRYASLEALQEAALGKKNNSIQNWLERTQLGDKQRLAQVFSVAEGYETAVETVLGDYLQGVCIEDIGALGKQLDTLDQGALVLIDQQQSAASGTASTLGSARALSEYVTSGAATVRNLLSDVFVVDTLDEGLGLRAQLAPQQSLITRDGVWMGLSWLRISKESDEQSGVLSRQQDMQTLSVQIEQYQNTIAAEEARYTDERQRLAELEQTYQQQQARQATDSRHHAELRSQLSAQQVKVEQMQNRKLQLSDEAQQLENQLEEQKNQQRQARRVLEEALEQMALRNEERAGLQAEREQNRAQVNELRQRANTEKEQSLQVAMRLQSLRSQLEHATQNMGRMQAQLKQLQERKAQLENQRLSFNEPDTDYQAELDVLLEKRLQTEHQLQSARQTLNEVEHKIRETEQQRQQAEARTQRLRQELETQRLGAQEDQLRCANLLEQLQTAGQELEPLLQALPEDAREADWEAEIAKLGRSIANLGPINLAAIDEFEVESERKSYLDKQFADLSQALETLSGAIRKIDKETRERFKDTFERVNHGIQELFPKVFGGGSAMLELTDDDLLNAGVLIKARPPGKRNSTIHLLSGGEKALTALALVFSIFRLNPAPFCMLDEVDAPLDDANVGRYATLVKEMSEQVQFVYITHNKITMEHADHLLGVTMHEPGVSRMVSVDVQEAVELVAV